MRAKIINDGESQIVNLPEEFNLTGTEVEIHKIGCMVLIEPLDDKKEN